MKTECKWESGGRSSLYTHQAFTFFSKRKWLLAVTVATNKRLLVVIITANKGLLSVTVTANKGPFAVTITVKKTLLWVEKSCILIAFWNDDLF